MGDELDRKTLVIVFSVDREGVHTSWSGTMSAPQSLVDALPTLTRLVSLEYCAALDCAEGAGESGQARAIIRDLLAEVSGFRAAYCSPDFAARQAAKEGPIPRADLDRATAYIEKKA